MGTARVLTIWDQIWFQNRRQSSRRRSRPLLPHEIAQYQMARSSGCVAQSSSPGLQDFAPTVAQHTVSGTTSGRQPIPGEQHPVSYPRPDGLASNADVSFVTAPGRSSAVEPVRTASSIQVLDIEGVETVAQDHCARRSDQSLDSESVRLLPAPAAVREAPKTLRLSMTSEGKAEVTCKSASSPSPPRPHQVGDNQHVSTVPLLDPLLVGKDVRIQPLKRASSGRSRDSRAWEFWCDKDARGELEYKADKDASGSAADAIGLLRSNSGRRVLGSLPAKRNIQQSRSSVNPKRHKHGGEKTGLQRSVTHDAKVHSVMHRAQNGTLSGLPTSSIPGNQKRVPGNDSDKENWSPEGLASEDRGAAATDSSKVPSRHTMSSNRSYDQSFTFVEPSDVVDPEEDPEIAAFMNPGRRSSSVSGEEEMDCVHGLLSLSQGNWR